MSIRAHPRSRGENGTYSHHAAFMRGSSPLTRGKLGQRQQVCHGQGLIPAHAGKTIFGFPRSSSPRAHPRSRGENRIEARPYQRVAGSSPLTRGKLQRIAATATSARLIPAHAGKTSLGKGLSPVIGAHPRSRGENHVFDVGGREYSGSSPLTRGKRMRPTPSQSRPGLIPAHAGKTDCRSLRCVAGPAHPRSRGENLRESYRAIMCGGSSPLTRGKLRGGDQVRHRQGLIPAHAGKTSVSPLIRGSPRAHPRSRGENKSRRSCRIRLVGSSPLTRGKPGPGARERSPPRLIPAHAGKTPAARPPRRTPRAHPRSRGENRRFEGRRDRDVRLIPAHAGKTSERLACRSAQWAHPRSRGENTAIFGVSRAKQGSSPLTRGKRKLWWLDPDH